MPEVLALAQVRVQARVARVAGAPLPAVPAVLAMGLARAELPQAERVRAERQAHPVAPLAEAGQTRQTTK
ncbi:hypothetical protein [Bradyrhizobium australiense]|uniref:Uncharacterized protein n=1 Tax=Bradyrhizobium australiense TaxID=2721161 RepID=A0A7Y4GVY5_9BRAD|nr:hypothetical protein [Bradyrhizobium australiense]NOJ42891.1 hypothetical protein [Bradyrhizobium australiense]